MARKTQLAFDVLLEYLIEELEREARKASLKEDKLS